MCSSVKKVVFNIIFFYLSSVFGSGHDKTCSFYVPNIDRIYRPCPNFGLDCVRTWLGKRMQCGGLARTGSFQDQIIYFNYFNVTAIQKNLCIEGLEFPAVEEFYVNPVTDRIVLTLGFGSVTIYSTSTFYIYGVGEEPRVATTPLTERYSYLRATTIFHGIERPTLKNSEIHMRGVGDGYKFGNCELLIKLSQADPILSNIVKLVKDNKNVAYQESFMTRGPFFTSYAIQTNICNECLNNDQVMHLYRPL